LARLLDDPIAAFTAILTISTVALWVATRRGAKIAERALIELERPFVFAEITKPGISIHGQMLAGGPSPIWGELELSLVNLGRTPAILTRLEYEINPADSGNIACRIDPLIVGGRELPVGTVSDRDRPYSERENIRFRFIEHNKAIAEMRMSLWIVGFVRYDDIFGRHYITGFSQAYDSIGQRFVARGSGIYNYSRTEKEGQIPPPSSRG
jgi:hypothetical protein